MSEDDDRLSRAIARIDAVNAEDPRTELAGGTPVPKELLYARRMSEVLGRLVPGASEALRIAVRAQHIARWKVPRTDFPDGRKGYHQWRVRLMEMHGEKAAAICREVGYDEATATRVERLVRKKGLGRDPEVQALEDVACLVFLEHHFASFAEGRDDAQLIEILRKTWAKMSDAGHAAALSLDLGERAKGLVERALA